MNGNPMFGRTRGHRHSHGQEGFRPRQVEGFGPGAENFDPEGFDPGAMGFDPEEFDQRCRRFGPGGFPPHGMPPRGGFPPHGGPGGPGFPHRRPDPGFLKRRVEDADLSELMEMAGRMLHRRPQVGPARSQALILSILASREALSQRELQQMLGIQPGSLSELLNKLEAKGLLTRERAEDRRGNLLRITDAGRQAIPAADDCSDDAFSPLTPDQQDQLAGMLRQLLTAWIDRLASAPPAPRDLTRL